MAPGRLRRLAEPARRALCGTLVAMCLGAIAAPGAAAPFSEALWNEYDRYEASAIPEGLLFGTGGRAGAVSSSNDDGSATTGGGGPPLFPLDLGWDVQTTCHGPSRPFPSPRAALVPGACEYHPTDAHTYQFWQKLPGDRLRNSNCYCYALDRYEGAWCYPGLGSGLGDLVQTSMSCADLSRRVASDGGAPASRADALGGAPPPAGGHYVALFLRPQEACDFPHCGPDFHFMRRDDGGTWSQKAGEAPATNRDADGREITDPEEARITGGYTRFCGYFSVMPSSMRVGTQRAPDRVASGVARWHAAGLDVAVTPLGYDPATDYVSDADIAARAAQLQALQRGEMPPPVAANRPGQQPQHQHQQHLQMAKAGRRMLLQRTWI